MAKIRRAGFGTVFNIENEKVGIGTTGKFFTEVRVLKNLELSDANAVTQAQLENYQGFLSNETRLSGNDVDLNKLVGYVRGEAYYGESHAHTQDDGTVVNMVGSAHTTFSHNVIDDSSNIQSGAMGDIIIDGEFTVSSGTTYCSSVEQLTNVANFTVPTGDTDDRIHCHTAGSMRFNEDLGTLEFYTGDEWKTVNSFKDTGNRGRGVFGGGYDGSLPRTSAIRHINIASQGNAITGGDLLSAATRVEACGNAVRSVWGGGYTPSHSNVIQYRSAASDGDTVDFGNLVTARSSHFSASSSTRGTWGGGYSPGHINSINYIEIMTTGDALDFGDIGVSGPGQINATQSPTRAVLGGGTPGNGDGKMTTFNFSSKGNSIFFGNLTQARRDYGGGGNNTRGVFCGGSDANSSSIIDFITIASDGNATFFGDLTQEKRSTNCCDSQTRTVIAGSSTSSGRTNVIDYITIATTGNAQDFGDDIGTVVNIGTTSDSHGGLGGF